MPHNSLEKYTSHFIWKGSKGLLEVLLWEGVGERTELQHIDPHSISHNSVSFPFSWAAQPGLWGPLCLVLVFSTTSYLQLVWSPTATAQSEAWGPTLLGAGFLYCILSPTDWTPCAQSYIIVRRPPSSCGRHKSHSFNPSTVKVIFWYSSTGCTCYLHRCIFYFDSPAGSEVNIQHGPSNLGQKTNQIIIRQIFAWWFGCFSAISTIVGYLIPIPLYT